MFYITWNEKLAEGYSDTPSPPAYTPVHCDTLPTVLAQATQRELCLFHEVIQPLFSWTFLSCLCRHRSQNYLFSSSSLFDSTKFCSVNAFEHLLVCHVMRVRNFHWFMAALHFNCATATRQRHVILWPYVMALYTTFCDHFIKQLETSTLLNIRSNTVHWQKIGCWLVNEFENKLIM